eukprot:scaffold2.g7189.t1
MSESHMFLDKNVSLQSRHFASWRLASDVVASEDVVALPGPVAVGDEAGGDAGYVAARNAALHNHLIAQPGGFYSFHTTARGVELCKVDVDGQNVALRALCVLDGGEHMSLDGPALQPTAIEVQGRPPGAAEAPAQPALLVSRGLGDLALAVLPGLAPPGPAAYPLRPPPPLQGARPLQLLAACWLPAAGGPSASSGAAELVALAWTVRPPTSARQPSACEVYALMLVVPGIGAAAGQQQQPAGVEVRGVQLLRRSRLPPHGAAVDPACASLLLVLDPEGGGAPGEPDEAAAQRAAGGAGRAAPGEGGDSGDVSPRTLQAAAARLAQFTSDQPVEALPHQQYADVFHESGPDGVGAMGAEPGCSLFCYALQGETPADDGATAAGAAAARTWSLAEALHCAPHRLLSCQVQAGGLLLGLTDDVDCAVVAVAPASSAGTGSGAGAGGGFAAMHVASIPALGYVCAGKVLRKYLLLAPPGGRLGAALVEGQQYTYLYRATAPKQEYGQHQALAKTASGLPQPSQVLDMGLAAGGGAALGAALAGAGPGAGTRLLVLSRDALRVFNTQ